MNGPVSIFINTSDEVAAKAEQNDVGKISFYSPDLSVREVRDVSKVIGSRWITKGKKVSEFEQRIARNSGCTRAVAYDSCTGAMEMALRVLGIGPGDEVITTPYTYSATAEVIRNVGATIVFVDLDGESFEMDYEKVSDAITERTKAVMPVDIGGKICNYEKLLSVLDSKRELFTPNNSFQSVIGRVAIIADAAHSFGATRKGKASGEWADFTCFSFHVLKNITTGGEGGAVVWNDFEGIDNDEVEQTLRYLGDHGQTSRDKSNGWEYDIAMFGYNSIMTDVDAAMGLAQLDRLSEITEQRKHITKKFDALFADGIVKPLIQHIGDDYQSAMHLYPIRVPASGKTDRKRNKIYTALKEAGVPCNVHYKPLPMMTAYKNIGFDISDYPNAYEMFRRVLTIPYYTDLTDKQIEYIAKEIKKVVKSV